MFGSGWWMFWAFLAPCVLAGAFAYVFVTQRRMTSSQRQGLEEALRGDYVDDEDGEDCPVRIDTSRRVNREVPARSAYGLR